MKHLRKALPAILLACAVIICLCVASFSSPIDSDVKIPEQVLASVSAEQNNQKNTDDKQSDSAANEAVTPDKAATTTDDKKETTLTTEKKEVEPKPTSSTSIVSVGIVQDDVNLRKTASTQSDVLSTLSSGTTVSILSEKDGWYQISYDGKKGFMSTDYVASKTSASDLKGYAKITTDVLNMRDVPNTDGDVVAAVAQGEYVTLNGFENGWYKVSYDDYAGYMSGDYLSLVAQKPEPKPVATTSSANSSPSGSSSNSSTPSLPSGQSAGSGYGTGSDIADYALSFCGVTYAYGGASPSGFDCSGFTMYVYDHFGYDLPHGATSQMNYGSAVSMSDLTPGDLVFFFDSDFASSGASHVGIYIGGGQIVHASSGPGYCVKVSSFYGDSSTGNYYSEVYLTARHIAN